MKPDSLIIKTCLMSYFRFKRQWICVDELHTGGGELADLVVDTGTDIREIEIKVDKYDLWKGESRKSKHQRASFRLINSFYLCVPTELVEEGLKWIEQTNPKYGLIEFNSKLLEESGYRNWLGYLTVKKKASCLNPNYKSMKESISRRLNSALITQYERIISNKGHGAIAEIKNES
jgi:hypothetical protein